MRFPLSLTLSLGSYIGKNKMSGNKRFPLVMMLEPLHTCNLRCSGCGRIREYSETLSKMMTVDECLRASDECGAPIVSICGGEPLIYPEIGELVKSLIAKGRHIYLCTNALKLKDSLHLFEPSDHLIFNVHLDGQEATHDAIVCRPGTFKNALEGIAAAKEKGFLVSTNSTIYSETEMSDIEGLLTTLAAFKVDCHMIAPGYDYEAVQNGEFFLKRKDIAEKFKKIDKLAEQFPLSDTPIYIDFLKGLRDMPCAPWGSPTCNPVGWRSPCYMLADTHYDTFKELMEKTDWDAYGPGNDPRCEDCMVHCGFETSIAITSGLKDMMRMAAWQLK